MSTILKALRRLEEEADAAKRTREMPRVTGEADPVHEAGEALRERILAEEAAAEALSATSGGGARGAGTPGTPRAGVAARIGVLVLMGLAGFGLAFGVMQWIPGQGGDDGQQAQRRDVPAKRATLQPDVSPRARPLDLAPTAATPSAIAWREATRPAVRPEARPTPTLPAQPPSPRAAIQSAAVVPTPAARALAEESERVPETVIPTRTEPSRVASKPQPSRPPARTPREAVARVEERPSPTVRERTSALAPVAAQPAAPPDPRRSPAEPTRSVTPPQRSVAVAKPEPRPEARRADPEVSRAAPPPIRESEPMPREAARAPRTPIPDVSVLRTSWHPSPDRRSAKVRLEATGEELSLGEGDAVGSLVVKAISPSAVTFQAGDVEVRRRVGAGQR